MRGDLAIKASASEELREWPRQREHVKEDFSGSY